MMNFEKQNYLSLFALFIGYRRVLSLRVLR